MSEISKTGQVGDLAMDLPAAGPTEKCHIIITGLGSRKSPRPLCSSKAINLDMHGIKLFNGLILLAFVCLKEMIDSLFKPGA